MDADSATSRCSGSDVEVVAVWTDLMNLAKRNALAFSSFKNTLRDPVQLFCVTAYRSIC